MKNLPKTHVLGIKMMHHDYMALTVSHLRLKQLVYQREDCRDDWVSKTHLMRLFLIFLNLTAVDYERSYEKFPSHSLNNIYELPD